MKKSKKFKVFISGPMSRKTDIEVQEYQKRVMQKVQKIADKIQFEFEIEKIDNYNVDVPDDIAADRIWCYCLGESIKKMSRADVIIFAREIASRGVLIERYITKLHTEIETYDEEDLEEDKSYEFEEYLEYWEENQIDNRE